LPGDRAAYTLAGKRRIMKVLGEGKNNSYICEISHTELEKFMNQYYGKMKSLKIGEEVNLGEGYDFYIDTKAALKETSDFIKANSKIIDAIMNGFRVLGEKSE
jgi:hypothetical protein